MSDKFDPYKEARNLRLLAKLEVHSDRMKLGRDSLFSRIGTLGQNPVRLTAVAHAFEATNRQLGASSQAKVTYESSGEVRDITFAPGTWDLGRNPRVEVLVLHQQLVPEKIRH